MKITTLKTSTIALLAVLWLSIAEAAPIVSQQIEPATIALGSAARLTVTASGDTAITPPMVPGLEFVAVGQSRRIESVNGVTRSTSAVTYQVSASQPGVYTIPGSGSGSEPLVLTVTPDGSGSHASTSPADGNRERTDASAFVRLRLPKHDLYVGEVVPVDIQVGVREGIVVSLNGLPTLNGDAFTLNKLSGEPQRAEEVIGGKPFTVFTWHSALAAVKPGALSLTMAIPLTERVRTARVDSGLFRDAGMDDLFNDPAFQDLFSGSTEREVTARSVPASFTVLALPTEGRPADFSGAVGHFTVNSSLSESSAKLGDPLTLSLRVSGTGNFDRVNARMLTDVEHWKSYAPTSTFKPADDIGLRGEKTFEQPIIATQTGPQVLPAILFSWFDPATRHYETAHTEPLTASIAPSADAAPVALASPPPANAVGAAAPETAASAMRPDHVDTGEGPKSLLPDYYRPAYVALPSVLILAFLGAWAWVRRGEQAASHSAQASAPQHVQPYLSLMEKAGAANDAELFFKSARTALQIWFAPRWHLPASAITEHEVERHLGADHDVSRLFTLADESAYAGVRLNRVDFAHWKRLVTRQIQPEALS
jgi:hypothetical protein